MKEIQAEMIDAKISLAISLDLENAKKLVLYQFKKDYSKSEPYISDQIIFYNPKVISDFFPLHEQKVELLKNLFKKERPDFFQRKII